MTTSAPILVDQTILASDPKRLGNCVAACVASYFGVPLATVPHFLEIGQNLHKSIDSDQGTDSTHWWALLLGYMAGRGLWPVDLQTVKDGRPGEVLFVAGNSPRGVLHQVLYRDGALWHDPHPSRDGILDVVEVIAWRPAEHDHEPTGGAS